MPIGEVAFEDLANADLNVDAVYRGGTSGTAADDPIQRLLPVGNQGGFRYAGGAANGYRLVVLYTTGDSPDWPDVLDERVGLFTYYGDNRAPGRRLHETPRQGNKILRETFEACHSDDSARRTVPPFLLFAKANARGRDVRFRGLLAPGGPHLSIDDDLQAIWRTSAGNRFQNYRARFTVLDVPVVSRAWIEEILQGNALGAGCPAAWRAWVEGRSYDALVAPSTAVVRTPLEQLPKDSAGHLMLDAIIRHFSGRPTDFEACAVQIWRMVAPATGATSITRPVVDHGRDAIGVYELGPAADRVPLEFVLEAKCYSKTRPVGVKDMSRLISRIRHRMFGVLVTTSFVHHQAYAEVREDEHPIVIISGGDIVDILRAKGYGDAKAVQAWLRASFPDATRSADA